MSKDRKLRIPALLESGWDGRAGQIAALRKSEYYALLTDAYTQLRADTLYDSHLHGVGHIERVILLGALIARNEGFSRHDAVLLLRCCAYHDLGREDDGEDPGHGERSAKKLASAYFDFARRDLTAADLPILYAAVAAHSMSDRQRGETGRRYGIPDGDLARYEEIAACLKDADNLDRVRLGDLDPSHLRHEMSLALVPFAEELFQAYERR